MVQEGIRNPRTLTHISPCAVDTTRTQVPAATSQLVRRGDPAPECFALALTLLSSQATTVIREMNSKKAVFNVDRDGDGESKATALL